MEKIKTYIDKCFSYIENCKKEIDKYDIISFDCWDTLIVRPFHDPYTIQKYINNSYYECRFRNLKHFGNDIEQSIELSLCQPRTDIYKLYEYAKQKNKQIIIISDFYFNKYFINKILLKCGYTIDINDINISCDFKDSKTNTLYQKISNKYANKKILHIGDNKLSDCIAPLKFHIDSFFIPQIHQTFKSIFNFDSSNINCCFSAFIGRLANNLLKYNNLHAQLGTLFAFIPEALLNHSINICKQYNAKSMLFIGRDMYIPYQHFNKSYINGIDYVVQYIDTEKRRLIDEIYPIDNTIICQSSTTNASIQKDIKLKYNKHFNYAIIQSGIFPNNFNTLIQSNIFHIRHITEAALRAPYIIKNKKRTEFTDNNQKEEYIPRINAECEFNYLKNINYTHLDCMKIFDFIFSNFNSQQLIQTFTYYRND